MILKGFLITKFFDYWTICSISVELQNFESFFEDLEIYFSYLGDFDFQISFPLNWASKSPGYRYAYLYSIGSQLQYFLSPQYDRSRKQCIRPFLKYA